MRSLNTLGPLMLWSCAMSATGQGSQGIAAPNVVAISESLVTAGQPTAESLARLSRLGFQVVIYLAPSTVGDAVAEEPELIRSQGMEFVHIPIQWTKPTEAD